MLFYNALLNLKKSNLFIFKALPSPSSSSSSSTSSNNELSIQLQPQLLEKQQYLDLVQTSRNNDRKALDLVTQYPSNFPANYIPHKQLQLPNILLNQKNFRK